MMNILYSGFADSSHSANGGYDKISNIPVENKRTLLSNDYFLWNLDKKFHLKKIPLWLTDFHTRILRRKFDVTHLFYGEITMFPFIPYFKSNEHKTVITLHLDIEKQHLHSFFLKSLKYYDGIIVLSTQQQKYYKEKYGIETTFIPHGFDSPMFKPILPKDFNGRIINRSLINIITTGKNYRDFNTLECVISNFKNDDRFHFHVVGVPNDVKLKLSKYFQHVSLYSRLSDDEYYSLIQSCDYNFLPLLFATANNSLLEAQALGVRSILPNIDGITDYAAPSPLNIFYESANNLMQIVSSLNKSQTNDQILKFSENFNWKNIFTKLLEYYKTL